jgi:flagellar transcriptional activator FlhC
MLVLAPCSKCKGKYVVNALDLNNDYQCGLCHMPSRAGKTRKAKDAAALAAA